MRRQLQYDSLAKLAVPISDTSDPYGLIERLQPQYLSKCRTASHEKHWPGGRFGDGDRLCRPKYTKSFSVHAVLSSESFNEVSPKPPGVSPAFGRSRHVGTCGAPGLEYEYYGSIFMLPKFTKKAGGMVCSTPKETGSGQKNSTVEGKQGQQGGKPNEWVRPQ
ncbi:unnamed protein product [Calypogeia fissa]